MQIQILYLAKPVGEKQTFINSSVHSIRRSSAIPSISFRCKTHICTLMATRDILNIADDHRVERMYVAYKFFSCTCSAYCQEILKHIFVFVFFSSGFINKQINKRHSQNAVLLWAFTFCARIILVKMGMRHVVDHRTLYKKYLRSFEMHLNLYDWVGNFFTVTALVPIFLF